VFVYLYRVTKQSVRASVESYSIKRLEDFYGYVRTVDLRDAGSSIATFETWLELGGDVPDDPNILERIREYNRDDCLSTWKLRDWLEERRAEAVLRDGDLPRPEPQSSEAPEDLSEALAEIQALVDALTEGVSADAAARSARDQARWLLAQLLNWHRRENKSTFWRYFYLLDLTDEERIDEPDSLGGLTPLGKTGEEKQSSIYRFSFPAQDHKIGEGSSPKDQVGRGVGTVVSVDDEQGFIEIKRAKRLPPPEPTSLIPLDTIPEKDLVRSLKDNARWVVENTIDAPGEARAARDLLLREPPRFTDGQGGELKRSDESARDAALRLVALLDASYLAIQGPPGSGKTTVGGEMIVDLVATGHKVGVTGNSHKVIGNMLAEVAKAAAKRGATVRIAQRTNDDEPAFAAARPLTNDEARDALAANDLDVVGGTAWLWCREDMRSSVDYLFIDEAGQMSLANAIAAAPAATNLVLLGDPQQLDQPLKGVHPPGAERSALGHLLGEHATMPPDLGLFIEGTWRLHPAICAYTSEVFYESRLKSHPGRDLQTVHGNGGVLDGAGVRLIAVDHEGHTSDADEEAEAVAELVGSLLDAGATWTDDKGNEQPLTLDDILVITPYNAQVTAIAARLPGASVGTVDKFQGRQAAIAIYSMATSTPADAPRGMEFLYSLNRLNVATSRARCIAAVVASPHLLRVKCRTPRQMRLANALARFVEMAGE